MREKGQVQFFDESRGFGFIVKDSGDGDTFVHRTQLSARGSIDCAMAIESRSSKCAGAMDAPRRPRSRCWGGYGIAGRFSS